MVIDDIDINEGTERRRDKNKMRMLLKSLARNEASIVENKTIIKDYDKKTFIYVYYSWKVSGSNKR